MKIVITSPVQRDGKELEIGELVDIPKKDAQALVDAGAAVLAGSKAKAPTQGVEVPPAPADGEETGGAGESAQNDGDDAGGEGNPPADA